MYLKVNFYFDIITKCTFYKFVNKYSVKVHAL